MERPHRRAYGLHTGATWNRYCISLMGTPDGRGTYEYWKYGYRTFRLPFTECT
jgi:hypothetical protein